MPSVDITQELYEYRNNNLVNDSIDATIRMLIDEDDLRVDQARMEDIKDTTAGDSDINRELHDHSVVGGKSDSTNSGYIR